MSRVHLKIRCIKKSRILIFGLVRRNKRVDVNPCTLEAQVLQKASMALIEPFLDPESDVIVSMEQTRHRLLALSCLCPGASTLIGTFLNVYSLGFMV